MTPHDVAAIRNRLFWADDKPNANAGQAIHALCDALEAAWADLTRVRAVLVDYEEYGSLDLVELRAAIEGGQQ